MCACARIVHLFEYSKMKTCGHVSSYCVRPIDTAPEKTGSCFLAPVYRSLSKLNNQNKYIYTNPKLGHITGASSNREHMSRQRAHEQTENTQADREHTSLPPPSLVTKLYRHSHFWRYRSIYLSCVVPTMRSRTNLGYGNHVWCLPWTREDVFQR